MSTIPAPPKTQRPCSRARPRRLRVSSGVVCTGTVPNAAPGWPRLPDFWPALQRVGAGRRGRPPLSPAGARVARASWPWAQGPSLFLGSKVLVMLTTHPGAGAEGDSSGVRERSPPHDSMEVGEGGGGTREGFLEAAAVSGHVRPAGVGGVLPVPLAQGELQAAGHHAQVPLQVSGTHGLQGLQPVPR